MRTTRCRPEAQETSSFQAPVRHCPHPLVWTSLNQWEPRPGRSLMGFPSVILHEGSSVSEAGTPGTHCEDRGPFLKKMHAPPLPDSPSWMKMTCRPLTTPCDPSSSGHKSMFAEMIAYNHFSVWGRDRHQEDALFHAFPGLMSDPR